MFLKPSVLTSQKAHTALAALHGFGGPYVGKGKGHWLVSFPYPARI